MRSAVTSKTLLGLMKFAMMAVLTVSVLALLDRFISSAGPGFARKFATVEDARRSIGASELLVPSYFPEGISWPPSLIVAQQRPFRAAVMEFANPESKQTMLVIEQSDFEATDNGLVRIALENIVERTTYSLKGTSAVLQVGSCGGHAPCSRIMWRQDGTNHTVLLLSSPFELIKIADSMVH